MSDEPDWGLLESMVDRLPNVPVICEGRIHTPRQARRARDIGAWAVVVGTAITCLLYTLTLPTNREV